MPAESSTDDFQALDSVKKKKKKRRLDRGTPGHHADTGFLSPLSSDHSSVFSLCFDEGSETPQKKSKKKAKLARSDSQSDYSCIATKVAGKDKTGVGKPEKKKKRKLGPSQQGGGDQLYAPLSQEETSSQPSADRLGNGDCTDGGTPAKKKRVKAVAAKQNGSSKVSAGPTKNRTDSISSEKPEETSHSGAEDSQVELFTSTPCGMLHLSLSQEKAATKLATSAELGGFVAPRKPPMLNKSSGLKHSDSTDVTPRKPRKHKKSSGMEDADTTDVIPKKPHKDKKSSGVEDSDATSITPRKPHKHKKSSDMEDSDTTYVTPSKQSKHQKFTGVKESDSTDVTPKKPHRHKKSSGVEDSDTTDITPRKSHKRKESSGMEDSDTTYVTSSKPCKHKKSSGVKESDSTDITPRKSHKRKESSGMEDSDTTYVTSSKPCKHKKSSGVKESDSTDITPRKSHEHRKSSDVEDSDTTYVTPSKPCKRKKSTGVKESDSADVTPRKPHEHRKSSDVEDSDTTYVTPSKPCKRKKSTGVKESDSADVTPRKPHEHRKSSDVEDSASSSVGFEMEETVKSVTNHDQIKDQSQATCSPLEGSNELPKIPADVRELSSAEQPASESFFIEDNEFLDSSAMIFPDLDTAIRELEEFIPHVRNLSASAIRQMARRDLIRFKNFKKKGIAVRFGKFTKKENDLLRRNVEAFLKESGVESAEKLLFTHRFPKQRAAITKLKSHLLFGIRIAEGIPRPWRLVYYRARKIFDPNNYNGRYSDKEKKKLLKYQAMYGNNWKKISQQMSRSSHSVALKYSQIKSEPKSGPWSREETKRLIQAVKETLQENCKELSSTPDGEDKGKDLSVACDHLYKGISWVKVEAKVGTRHWRQCKAKWVSVVSKRMSRGKGKARKAQNLQFRINLIERLYELNIEDANEIDWEALSSIVGNFPPDYIRRRFYRLKASHVPFWNQKTFPEIIDHLHDVTLPKLTARLKSKKRYCAAEAQSTPVKEQRKMFQFEDIFQESSDELIEDSEDEPEAKNDEGVSESF